MWAGWPGGHSPVRLLRCGLRRQRKPDTPAAPVVPNKRRFADEEASAAAGSRGSSAAAGAPASKRVDLGDGELDKAELERMLAEADKAEVCPLRLWVL